MKRIKKMLAKIETTYYYYTRYTLCVQWRTVKQTKFFNTYAEALVWAAGYPPDATVMIGKRGTMLGARW